jgi:hypothetical protein
MKSVSKTTLFGTTLTRFIMKLRFTGENPPLELLELFPNWSNAYEEEDIEGQDETTLKPHDQQNHIDDEVSFTAADLMVSDGSKYVALVEVINGIPSLIDVYDSGWLLRNKNYPIEPWEQWNQDWLPENLRSKLISFEDTSIFPLRVKSRLPLKNSNYIHFQIESNGLSNILE